VEFILSHVEQGVMTITLNRPERLNSFNDVMHQQLAECLKQAERDDTVRCLLITGAGRGFCAGQDLNDRNVDPSGPAPDLGMSVETFYNPLVRRLAKLPKPVICAVNGVAAGAGATLALGCDMVIAARSANFVMAFSKLGLVPDCGGTGCCRAWPDAPAPWGWRCSATSSAPNRRRPGDDLAGGG
jgi:2-(1,2-epoxy-1,2-dihydrophenyl)acetyl-CoA isomerase